MTEYEFKTLDIIRTGDRVRVTDDYLRKLKYEAAISLCRSDGTIVGFDNITWHFHVKFDNGEEFDVRKFYLMKVHTPEIAEEYCKMTKVDSDILPCFYCPQFHMFDRRTNKEIEELKIPCWVNLVDRRYRDLEYDKRIIKT